MFLAALALVLLGAGPALAQLYRWTDPEGTDHYTTDAESIPEEFRDTAEDIGSPTPGPIIPVTPPAAPGAVIPYNGGPLVVDAAINGVTLRLLVDTGAERTLITHAALARAGIDISNGTPVQIRGVTGDASATVVSIPRLDVAGTRIGPLPVIVHTLTAQNIDGLLGRDVLDGFTVTVDAAARRATLVPR